MLWGNFMSITLCSFSTLDGAHEVLLHLCRILLGTFAWIPHPHQILEKDLLKKNNDNITIDDPQRERCIVFKILINSRHCVTKMAIVIIIASPSY